MAYMHGFSHMDGMWTQMWWGMWIFPILLLGGLIGFGVWAVRRFTDRGGTSEPRRILEERFARGEIDAEEFEERRRLLEGTGGTR